MDLFWKKAINETRSLVESVRNRVENEMANLLPRILSDEAKSFNNNWTYFLEPCVRD